MEGGEVSEKVPLSSVTTLSVCQWVPVYTLGGLISKFWLSVFVRSPLPYQILWLGDVI